MLDQELAVRRWADDAPLPIWTSDAEGRCTYVNRAWIELTGRPLDVELGEGWLESIHQDDLSRRLAGLHTAVREKRPYVVTYRLHRAQGDWGHVQEIASPHFDARDRLVGFTGYVLEAEVRQDALATPRRLLHAVTSISRLLLGTPRYEDVLPESLRLLGEIMNVDRVYVFENHPDPRTGLPLMSQRFEWSRTGVSAQIDNPELQGIPYEPLFEGLYEVLSAGKASRRVVSKLAEPERRLMEAQGIRSLLLVPIAVNGRFWGFVGFDDCHGERAWSDEEELILFAMAGSVGAAVERRLTDRLLQARDQLLRGAAAATTALLTSDDLDQGLRRSLQMMGEAAAVERVYLFENRQDGVTGEPLMHVRYVWQRGHATFIPPALPDRVYPQSFPGWYETLGQGVPIAGILLDFIEPADPAEESPRLRSVLLVPVITQSECWGFLGFDDVNLDRAWVSADESILQAVAGSLGGAIAREHVESELRVSEDRLRHAQKMEAVGRLAGGVAHDFNNLLTAIMGYSELILSRLNRADPLHAEVEEISRAAERAHAVTRQLLAFSRKQVLEPRVVNLNTIVGDMDRLLRRLIGENIELATHLERKPCLVKVDRNQIEQVIINLAVNARDAMPRGGKLVIETSRLHLGRRIARGPHALEPGQYIALSLKDTGQGMGDEVKAHVFEPFFTTKRVGEGTGLGLSMVYGIVEQSGGHILFDSEVGRGTTFVVYLPALREEVSEPPAQPPASATGGSETVLLVEDEEIVRELARRVLLQYGYRVLLARNGREAVELVEREQAHIDLLLTDMIMPHMTGRELARRLRVRFPSLRILYMSGYTEESIDDIADLGPDARFIQKPFTPSLLARHLRELLDKR